MNPQIREERSGWVDGVVRSLIQRAAHRAPPALSQRLEEEWLADLTARRGVIPRLRFALGCSWATRVIAHELGVSSGAAATATGNGLTVSVDSAPRFRSHGTTVFLLIAALHALVIYGLAAGITSHAFRAPEDPLQVTPVEVNAPRIQPPAPIADPTLTGFHFVDNDPLPPIAFEPDPVTSIGDPGTQPLTAVFASPPPSPRPVSRVTGGPGRGFPDTEDFYPDAARRLGEQGLVTVHVCVDGAGRLTAAPSVAQSSGSARLDEGALRLARAGSGHYRSTTEDGRPVSSCYPFRIRFDLRDLRR
jgi:TonB family protein